MARSRIRTYLDNGTHPDVADQIAPLKRHARQGHDQIKGEVETLLAWVVAASTLDLRSFEKQLLSRLGVLGRLLMTLFFETREARIRQTLSPWTHG
jgi:hypothetical protein